MEHATFRRITAIAAVLVALAAAGCSSSSERARDDAPVSGESGSIESKCVPPAGLSQRVHQSDTAVVATVSEVSRPRWNSKDGKAFGERLEKVRLTLTGKLTEYRTAKIVVEEVLWSSDALPARVGEPLTLTLLGSGRHDGDEYCGGGRLWNDLEGPIDEGRRVLLLLGHSDGPLVIEGQGRVMGNYISGHYNGNWTIEGDQAVSVVPERSVPLAALQARLVEVHNAPLDPGSRRGAIDPLEATEPPPLPEGDESPGEPTPQTTPSPSLPPTDAP